MNEWNESKAFIKVYKHKGGIRIAYPSKVGNNDIFLILFLKSQGMSLIISWGTRLAALI